MEAWTRDLAIALNETSSGRKTELTSVAASAALIVDSKSLSDKNKRDSVALPTRRRTKSTGNIVGM